MNGTERVTRSAQSLVAMSKYDPYDDERARGSERVGVVTDVTVLG